MASEDASLCNPVGVRMIKGSCLCGGVQYQINEALGPIIYCHCKRCRKSSGSACVTSTEIHRAKFEVTQGKEFIKKYENPGAVDRFFCSHCGSQLYSERAATPLTMRLRLGTLDTEITERVSSHIFVGSKAEWHEIQDEAVQYQERPMPKGA
jgi:hypothetical protein